MIKPFHSLALLLTAATVSLSFPAMAGSKNCIVYEPGVVNLTGKVYRKAVWLLELDKPVCIEGREKDKTGMYPTLDKVTTMVLWARKDEAAEKYTPFLEKEVVVTGTLHKSVDSAADQVTIMVSKIEEAGKK